MMIENGMVLPQADCFAYRDADEDVCVCKNCDAPKLESEMSSIDGMCADCYAAAIKGLQRLVEAQDDEAMLEVLCDLL